MSDSPSVFHSVFDEVHDVVIFGAGYAGFAAARALVDAGQKVLLVDRRAALLAESGWSFEADGGDNDSPAWQSWREAIGAHRGAQGWRCDGAIAEVIANEWVRNARHEGKLAVLYYAAPLAVERSDLLEAVTVGTKGGLQRIVARQWIDATETGELLGLLSADWSPPVPQFQHVNLYFRRAAWPEMQDTEEDIPDLSAGASLRWTTSLWPNERRLQITLPGDFEAARMAWIPALARLHGGLAEGLTSEAVLTHGSVEPFYQFEIGELPQDLPANVIAANPWCGPNQWIGQRFAIGERAAQQTLDAPRAKVGETMLGAPTKPRIAWREMETEIAVAGAGTGGALAALAAARQGAATLAFDPLPFCGGIGAGGGIHWYYFGVKGGLQDELDERMRAIMPLFAPTGQIQGFHPDAKKCVLEEMLRESGASLLFGATLLDVERAGDRVTSALLATPHGPLRLKAQAWIDGTGDGDLAARAGAGVRFGRDGDGLIHAYSQSSGRAGVQNDKARMHVVNFDAGFVDPTDSEDLTRARLEGIHHFLQQEYTDIERPTYIAPAIGLRQSRHIVTDYTLELSDLIERRRFADAVGLTGCHYDNHAHDYEFESDEAMFWVWVCRQWRGKTGCEIPYRILLPQGIDNVWLACRALGVSQDAHHSLRMQRDMQRIGEVSGIAATLGVKNEQDSRQISFAELRAALEKSGALQKGELPQDSFGPDTAATSVLADEPLPAAQSTEVQTWLAELQSGPADVALWHLYRHGENAQVREGVLGLLDDNHEETTWRAAAIAAMWDEARAEARLLREIENRQAAQDENSDKYRNHEPKWLIALSLLRRCGSPQALPLLNELAGEANLVHNVRTAIALCCEGIAARHELDEAQRQQVLEILWKLIEAPAPGAIAPPQRPLMQTEFGAPGEAPTARPAVREDWTWQLHLAVARSRRTLGLPPHPQAVQFLSDERALVRRAFTLVCGEVAVERPEV